MKLLNVLSVTVFGVLFAVGCSSSDTTTSTDSGTTADTGTATETGTDTGMAADTGTVAETGGDETGAACGACVEMKCKSEIDACNADPKCVAIIKCINDCKGDTTCGNACLNGTGKEYDEAGAIIDCGNMNCKTECGG